MPAKAPPRPTPPGLQSDGGGSLADDGSSAAKATRNQSVNPDVPARAPSPPSNGWTLAEAAAALCPTKWRKAAIPNASVKRQSGREVTSSEYDALRTAFRRLMETGEYTAEGTRLGSVETIPAAQWRAARPVFGLPGERGAADEVVCGYDFWAGVRVFSAEDHANKIRNINSEKTNISPENGNILNRGGRPPHRLKKHFHVEMFRQANSVDGWSDRGECLRVMLQWAEDNSPGEAPSEGTVRNWMNELWPPEQS